jgi:glycosyltransferase involved in cell wall biosynthesis
LAYEPKLHPIPKLSLPKTVYEIVTRMIRKSIDAGNIKKAKNILVSSYFVQKNIKRVYSKNSQVNHLGVNSEFFKPQKQARKKQLMFVGDRNYIKGYDFVQKLSRTVEKKDIKIKVFETKGEMSTNSDKVLSDAYSSSLATLCVSQNEPFGLSAIESMACATPVLAVNQGGFRESVIDGQTGFLLARNIKAFEQKIDFLIKNKLQTQRMGMCARKHVINNFSWHKHNQILNKAIRQAIQGGILISGQDSGGLGGAEKISFEVGSQLKKLGFDVAYSAVAGSSFEKFLRDKKALSSTIPLRMDIVGNWRGFVKFFFFLPFVLVCEWKILNKFKKGRGMVVIVHGFSDKLILTPLARFMELKVIWVEHGPFGYLQKRMFGVPIKLYRYFSEYADLIITPSQNTKDCITGFIKKPKEIQVIANGTKIPSNGQIVKYKKSAGKMRKELGIDDKFVVGIISRIEKGKGQDLLIKALPRLINKIENLHLLVVGEGEIEKMKKLAKGLGVLDRITFTGYWPDANQAISCLDIFAFPSTWELEGFGLVLLEAMALQVPIITTNHGPIPEIVKGCAIMIPPKEQSIADGIYRLYCDYRLRQRLVLSAKKRVKDKFDIRECGISYMQAINNLFGKEYS